MKLIQHIHVDSDNTIMDWTGRFIGVHLPHLTIEQFNRLPEEERNGLFDEVYKKDPRLFLKLSPFPYAERLIRTLELSGCSWGILSAIGRHPDPELALRDKQWCLETKLGIPKSKMIFTPTSKDKAAHAAPGLVLIDDFYRNCREWEEQGGTAIYAGSPKPDLHGTTRKLRTLIKITEEAQKGIFINGYQSHTIR